jgi:DUF1009 family protein
MEYLGLIAGNGRLPLELLRAAKDFGKLVAVIAVGVEMEPQLFAEAELYQTINPGSLSDIISFFKELNITNVVMAGKVSKEQFFKGVAFDERFLSVFRCLPNMNDDSILCALADEFESEGIIIENQMNYLCNLLPRENVLSQRYPSKDEARDIVFGFNRAKAIGGLDIGQTVVVKNCAVMSVEAIEGNDECIRRGGILSKGGATVVKVAKPNQDPRFDVPTIGYNTLQTIIEVGAKVLAFEANKTFVIDLPNLLEMANKSGIAVVSTSEGWSIPTISEEA